MPAEDDFWDFYWDTRLQPMENLGKRAAILSISKLIRCLGDQSRQPLRLLELGCGEGQVLGSLLEAHTRSCDLQGSVGVDYNSSSLARCENDHPGITWVIGDFSNPDLLAGLGLFDLVIFVNALHEVFSDAYSQEQGEIDVPAAKQRVQQAFSGAVGCMRPGSWLVLFDGVEPPGDPMQNLRIRFRNLQVRQDFERFAREYQPLRISYRPTENPLIVDLSRRDFSRYITKSIFLGKELWETERLQSYQYFSEQEFRVIFSSQKLEISELHCLTVNEEKWRNLVDIETEGEYFPDEHILILAQLPALVPSPFQSQV
jgi:SAM-dependent methyltransferase